MMLAYSMRTRNFLRSSIDLIVFETETMLDVLRHSSQISEGERAELDRRVRELHRQSAELMTWLRDEQREETGS